MQSILFQQINQFEANPLLFDYGMTSRDSMRNYQLENDFINSLSRKRSETMFEKSIDKQSVISFKSLNDSGMQASPPATFKNPEEGSCSSSASSPGSWKAMAQDNWMKMEALKDEKNQVQKQQTQQQACNKKRYKTEMCRKYLNNANNYCEYGSKCQYAHGLDELRLPSKHKKYKSELCRPFHTTGICPYGRRCDFIHNENPEKLKEIRSYIETFHELKSVYPALEDVAVSSLANLVQSCDLTKEDKL